MSVQNLIDRYSSTLGSGYTSGGSSITVSSASGLPSGACSFLAIVQAEGANTEEVFLVTNVSGTTLTVTGAQLGSSASNHASGATIIAGIWAYQVLKQVGPVLLEEHTASNSTNLAFTTAITSDFDNYMVELVNIIPVTNLTSCAVRFSTNGGSSYDTGSNYSWASFRNSAAGSALAGSNSQTFLSLDGAGGVSNVAANGGLCGRFYIYAPAAGATVHVRFQAICSTYDATSNPDINVFVSGSWFGLTNPVNAFAIFHGSGNVNTGIARCYGIPK